MGREGELGNGEKGREGWREREGRSERKGPEGRGGGLETGREG